MKSCIILLKANFSQDQRHAETAIIILLHCTRVAIRSIIHAEDHLLDISKE